MGNLLNLTGGGNAPSEKYVLVACEESQRVTIELRKMGINAFSCDIIDCSGGHDEWHIKGDVLPLLNGDCEFTTMDGCKHTVVGKWDMILGFPPCTHLAVSGAAHFAKKRADGRQREGIEFFCQFLTADCDHIAIENPVNIIGGNYVVQWFPDICEKYGLPVKPTQKIQPYEHGEPTRKTTCLWLKGLPLIEPTNIVEPNLIVQKCKDGSTTSYGDMMYMSRDDNGKIISWNDPRTATLRSKTLPGVGKAMAKTWGEYILKN